MSFYLDQYSGLANAGASASMGVEEVVFVIPITLHIAAGLLQQDQSVTVEPWGNFIHHRKKRNKDARFQGLVPFI